MNAATIYSKASGRVLTEETQTQVAKDKAQAASDEAARSISINQWLAQSETQAIIELLQSDIKKCDDLAREQSVSYYQHKNHDIIICNLIQAQTIRNVLSKITNSDKQ